MEGVVIMKVRLKEARGEEGVGLMSPRARIARTVPLAGVLALLAGALPGTASAGSCPNEEVRAEQGAERLPDCRAFELVTPEVKGDNSNIGGFRGAPFAFPDGEHVYYPSFLPDPGAPSGIDGQYLSTRTASGWVSTALNPPEAGPVNSGHGGLLAARPQLAFTADLSAAFIESLWDVDPLDQDGAGDAYRTDLSSGVASLAALPDTGALTASLNPPEVSLAGTYIAGVSANAGHVLFQSYDQLPVAPGTPSEPHPGNGLYDRTGAHTYAVGVLPNGKIPQTCNADIGDGLDADLSYGAVSPDGTNVVFTMGIETGASCLTPGVYVRVHDDRPPSPLNGSGECTVSTDACTLQLAGNHYAGRSSDGSKIFTVHVGGGAEPVAGLYEYDVASKTTTTISPEGAFVASAADGSRVYYLTGVTSSSQLDGFEGNEGDYRLYLWDKGASTLIPKAGEGFASYINPTGIDLATKGDQPVATPDGSKLLFLDRANLTGYNSFGQNCIDNPGSKVGFCKEAYVYDATAGSIKCLSCNPRGLPPLGNTHLRGAHQRDTLLPGYSEGEISPDGSRVFFETEDALVPQDTNGLMDVYERENGRIYLISSGQGTFGSYFAGASSNGDDVFFTTTDHLAPQDIETSTEIYDARVGGGFPYRPFTTGCNSGQCQGPQTPAPAFGAPASATFVGPGNPGGPEPGSAPVKQRPLSAAQKLAKALKACRARHSKHERLACEKRARRRYGHRSPSNGRPNS
jgi:hypothetical protein